VGLDRGRGGEEEREADLSFRSLADRASEEEGGKDQEVFGRGGQHDVHNQMAPPPNTTRARLAVRTQASSEGLSELLWATGQI
jgi:hypothetical protein